MPWEDTGKKGRMIVVSPSGETRIVEAQILGIYVEKECRQFSVDRSGPTNTLHFTKKELRRTRYVVAT